MLIKEVKIVILIFLLFIGCASKPDIIKPPIDYKSPYISETIENEMDELIRFEDIAKSIKDSKERFDFYLAVGNKIYQQTLLLDEQFKTKNFKLDNFISNQEKIYSDKKNEKKGEFNFKGNNYSWGILKKEKPLINYKTRPFSRSDYKKIKKFEPLTIEDTTFISRKKLKDAYLQAKELRHQYIELFKWSKSEMRFKFNYLREFIVSGPPVIYYLDNDQFINDYKLPMEKSKYLSKEPFVDSNKNKVFDLSEPFTDCNDAFTICSDDCEWENLLGNKKYDEGEFYLDSNLNGKYDYEEEYFDMNENGFYDAQPKNDIKVLLNYKKISDLIDDQYEKAKFLNAVAEALSIKVQGLKMGFDSKINKMKNLIKFYENEMEYSINDIEIIKPIEKIIEYRPIIISDENIGKDLFQKQVQIAANQYIISKKYYNEKLKEFRKVVKILEKDYEHRRFNYSVNDYLTNLDSYEFVSKYLSDTLRYNIELLLKTNIDESIYKSPKNQCDLSQNIDKYLQGFYYRALGEAISLHIDNIKSKFDDMTTTYLNTFDYYERKLGYSSNITFLTKRPYNDYKFETFLVDINDHKSINKKYFDQIDSLKKKYIDFKSFYDLRENEYKNYLRILRFDDARLKTVEKLSDIHTDSLLLNGIYTSPYYKNEMLSNEDSLLNYKSKAKKIDNPILRAEYYRNITETFYLAINKDIETFIKKQEFLSRKVSKYEKRLRKKYDEIKKRMPQYKELYKPIRIDNSTVNMRLHEMQAQVMQNQHKKINLLLDMIYEDYDEYLAKLDSIYIDKKSRYKEKQNRKIKYLASQEKKIKDKVVKRKYYKNEIEFLKNITIYNSNDYKKNHIEVAWDKFNNVIEIIHFDKKDVINKKKEFIYNKSNDLVKTIESKNDKILSIEFYKLESRGDKFLDFQFDFDITSAEINYGSKLYSNEYKNVKYVNRKSVFDKMKTKSLTGQIVGIIDINYDSNGNQSEVIWYIGNREEMIQEAIISPSISLEQ